MSEMPGDATVILLVDEMPLRRAAMVSLLTPWAESVGISRLEQSGDTEDAATCSSPWAMVLVSLGTRPLADPSLATEFQRIAVLAAEVPVVIVSDLQDAEEMAAAFQAGIRGFLPTTTTRDIALKALTFILRGGHYFPPSVLEPGSVRGRSAAVARRAGRRGGRGGTVRYTARHLALARDAIAIFGQAGIDSMRRQGRRQRIPRCSGGPRWCMTAAPGIGRRSGSPRCGGQVSLKPRRKAAKNGSSI